MLTKAMIEGYDGFKDNAPGATGMAAKLQTKNWSVPVHKGAVKALKEAGAWSDDQEKWNNDLFKRQETLIATWADFTKANPPSDPKEFEAGWMKGSRGCADQSRHAGRLLIEALCQRKRTPEYPCRQRPLPVLRNLRQPRLPKAQRGSCSTIRTHITPASSKPKSRASARCAGLLAMGADRRHRGDHLSASTSNFRCVSSLATPSSIWSISIS